MTTYLFPGQGSQRAQMGEALFAEFPEITQQADQILGYSIAELCLRGGEKLNQTNYSQPAIYVVSALCYMKKVKEVAKKPNYIAGHSLGEYNALFAADVMDFATGLKLVQKRGELMSQVKGGGMAAIIGLQNDQIEEILKKNNLIDLTIANYNSYTQSVISGTKEDIYKAQPLFEKMGAKYILLKVSGAFHSSYMTKAQQHFAEFVSHFTFNPPSIPVISNVTAKPYEFTNIAKLLTEQITHSVLWMQTIVYLLEQGETEFEEIGESTVLMGLTRRIQKGQ